MALPPVLIVDDDKLLRAMLRDALGDVPCEVFEADSGDAALAAFEQLKPKVMVLDLIMPGRSGLEVLKQLKGRVHHTHVVVLSSLDTEALVQQAIRDGAHGYLTKPFHPLDVQGVVRAALEAPEPVP